MEGPTSLVMDHIYNRQMSYKSGVMICRSTVDGTPLAEKLSTLSMTKLKKPMMTKQIIWIQIQEVCWKPYLPHAELWAILKKQQSMPDGAFAMLDHYWLNSLFWSTTPDDECSFSVRLYCKPQNWVSLLFFALISCFESKKCPLRLNWDWFLVTYWIELHIVRYEFLREFHVLKIMQKYALTVSCFNVLFNFDHDWPLKLFPVILFTNKIIK